MAVLNVMSGLMQMTQDAGLRSVASIMLANARMQSHQVSLWVQPKGPLRDLVSTLDHYARSDEQEARALLQYAAGERNLQMVWMLGKNPSHGQQVERIIGSAGNAKALIRLIGAVEEAQPNLVSVKPGKFVRSIGENGSLKWEKIDAEVQLADRPVSYLQFLPLAQYIGFPSPQARKKNVVVKDPILNVSQNLMEEWIRILNLLTHARYRLPKEKEWERGTAKNLRVVDLSTEASERGLTVDKLIKDDWHRRYANAFMPDPRNSLNLGAAVFNEPDRVLSYLRDGLSISAWDFSSSAEDTQRWENVYEHVSIGTAKPDMARHIGYRYFANRASLRNEPGPMEEPMNVTFRLAVSGLPPAPASGRTRGRR